MAVETPFTARDTDGWLMPWYERCRDAYVWLVGYGTPHVCRYVHSSHALHLRRDEH